MYPLDVVWKPGGVLVEYVQGKKGEERWEGGEEVGRGGKERRKEGGRKGEKERRGEGRRWGGSRRGGENEVGREERMR